jgi:hypothetical protein
MRDLTLTHQRQQYRQQQQLAKARARGRNASARTQAPASPGYIRRPSERAHNNSRPFVSYTCPSCTHHEALASTNRVFATEHRCPYCGIKMKRDREFALTLSLTTGKEVGHTLNP